MAKFDGVIFDWAGTTVDYGCFAPVQAFADSFAEFGVIPTMDEVRAPMGMLKRDHVRTMLQMERISGLWKQVHGREFTEEDVEAVYLRSESRIMELLDQFTDLKPYVKETVEELRRRGLKIGSTTGYTDEMMQVVVPAAAKKSSSRPRSSVHYRLNNRNQENCHNSSCKSIVIQVHSTVNNAHIQRYRRVKEACENSRKDTELPGNRRQCC